MIKRRLGWIIFGMWMVFSCYFMFQINNEVKRQEFQQMIFCTQKDGMFIYFRLDYTKCSK